MQKINQSASIEEWTEKLLEEARKALVEFYFIFTMRVLLQGRPGVGGYLRPDRLAGRHEGPVDPDRGSAQLQPAD